MTSTPDVEENLKFVAQQLAALSTQEPSLVVLPECFARFGARDGSLLDIAETKGDGPIQSKLQALAKQYQCNIISGTLPLKCGDDKRFTASSLFINDQGEIIGEYQKIHMFDVDVSDSTGSYKESKYTLAGTEVVSLDSKVGRIGMAVCYDVRFPGLFDAMGDVDIIVLPAAFTQVTGAAHWHTLVKARAIEKQSFIVAAGQTGIHANGRETYGHSVIYSPWGDMLAELPQNTGLIQCAVDLSQRNQLKRAMPVAQHNRFRSHFG
jgi:predicted amidohydrolase